MPRMVIHGFPGLSEISDAVQQELVTAFCPRFWLHKKEEYFPSDVEGYMEGCELWFETDLVLRRGEVDTASIVSQSCHGVPSRGRTLGCGRLEKDCRWRLRCDPARHYGVCKEDVDRVPVYTHMRETVVKGEPVLALVYATFYPYNGAYNVLGKLAGGHEGDWEHVTVHVHRKAGCWKLHSVWYNAHRERDGTLLPADKVEVEGQHPVVYVARNGHGVYWEAGCFYRIFGTANDECSKGTKWSPRPIRLPQHLHAFDPTFGWLWFPGRWGTPFDLGHCSNKEARNRSNVILPGGCPTGPGAADWWIGERCRSRTWAKRVFMPWA